MEIKALKATKAHRVPQGHRVPQAQRVQREQQAPQALKVKKVRQEAVVLPWLPCTETQVLMR